MADGFRCSVAAAAEPLAGSAATDGAFLLVENAGPWGRKALAESRLPEPVRTGLAERAEAAGVRVQLIRRHGRTPASGGIRVFLVYADPQAPWAETTVLAEPEELLDLDLAALAAGERPGLDPHEQPLLLVCTNGRRDACCAELGRPLVAAVTGAHAELTWETTHVGGHRFAGAMLVLPHGLAYGRVLPEDGVRLGDLALAGRLDPLLLRGRAAYPAPVQAAEVALLERLGLDGVAALALVGVDTHGDLTRVRFGVDGVAHEVEVEAVAGPAVRQSCADDKVKSTLSFRVR